MQLPKFPDEVTRIRKRVERMRRLSAEERFSRLLELFEVSEEMLSKCSDKKERLKIMHAIDKEDHLKFMKSVKNGK